MNAAVIHRVVVKWDGHAYNGPDGEPLEWYLHERGVWCQQRPETSGVVVSVGGPGIPSFSVSGDEWYSVPGDSAADVDYW